jgi:hypothetical protein
MIGASLANATADPSGHAAGSRPTLDPPPALTADTLPQEHPVATKRPAFWTAESPGGMIAQTLGGAAGAFLGALAGVGIANAVAPAKCADKGNDGGGDFGCGLGQTAAGVAIGMPLGHAFACAWIGRIQGKRGYFPVLAAALIGDFAIPLIAGGIHEWGDGTHWSKGEMDGWLIGCSLAGALTAPVAVQSIYDYQVRFLTPAIQVSPRAGLRAGMTLAEFRF